MWNEKSLRIVPMGRQREERDVKLKALFTAGKWAMVAVLVTTVLCSQHIVRYVCPAGWSSSSNLLHWQTLESHSSGLVWSSCGVIDGHDVQCARLDVPMDHFSTEEQTEEEAGPETETSWPFSLALIRLVGKNATKSILVNPGGPGGSGGEFIFRRGEQLNKIVGEDYYLLSFDPRGVNQSIPKAECFSNDIDRVVDQALAPVDPWTQSGSSYAYYTNLAQACHDVMGEYGAYFNTPQTAADMNSILDAIGQEKMIYWGFSYGTTLGQTYAQMYPDRIERLIIDGVSHQMPWYNYELSTASQFNSTDAVYEGFFEECFKAGATACPLMAGYSSAEALRQNVTDFILALRDDPIPVYMNASMHGSLSFSDVAWDGIFPSLYKPTTWPGLASILTMMMHGNLSDPFLAWSLPQNAWSDLLEANMIIKNNDLAPFDQIERAKLTRPAILAALEQYRQQSYLAGDTEAPDLFGLEAWNYARTHSFVPAEQVKTAHPLLILSTSLDPICPISSARKANAVFEDSVLLEQKSMGHCTVSMPSKCTAQHVQRYLDTGALPEHGTTCNIDEPYFPDPDQQPQVTQQTACEDEELSCALRALASDPPWSKAIKRSRAR